MSREEEELDMAVPSNFDAINDYYRENLKKIIDSDTYSLTESILTIHSVEIKIPEIDDGSSTASDSDIEDLPKHFCATAKTATATTNDRLSKVNNNICSFSPLSSYNESGNATTTSTIASDNVQNKLQNINSIAISNSTDVHFGNKSTSIYNGPVTIKQIVISDYLEKRDDTLGTVNKGFEGSSTHVNSPSDNDNKKNENSVQNSSGKNTKRIVITRNKIFATSITIICSILAILAVILIYFQHEQEDIEEPNIISRDQWHGLQPKESLTKLELPVNRVIICHTVTPECFSEDNCKESVQAIQNLHFNTQFNFSDIAYNFLIGGDGNVYEGRGWKDQGAHTSGYNRGSIGVAFIGNFVSKIPNETLIQAGFKLFNKGVRINALVRDYKIFAASQLRDTQSPGQAFFEVIKKWEHWSDIY